VKSDLPIAIALLLCYLVLVLGLLPPDAYPLMLGGGVLLVIGTAFAAGVWPGTAAPAGSLMVVSFVASAVLVMPNFPAMGGSHPLAPPLGFLGAQVITLLWVALRWPPWRRSSTRTSLGEAVLFGAIAAVLLSVVASIPIAIALVVEPEEVGAILWVYPAYLAGALAASLLYWLLQGVAHRPTGLYLIGVLGGACVYGAIAPVVSLVDGEPLVLSELLEIATVCGVFVGPPVAFGVAEPT
jgi:hypothetical protein